MVYPVRIDDYHALLSLPEDLCKLRAVYVFAAYHVAQHVACADRRQLIRIAHYHESCTRPYRADQTVHQYQIYHRRFVDYHSIVIQRILLRLTETHHVFTFRKIVFEQTMYRRRIMSRGLGYAFCRSARRRRDRSLKAAFLEYIYYRVYMRQ